MEPGKLYFLKNEYLEEYNLSMNKGIGHDRPFFCGLQDKFIPEISWVIPLSTQVDHYDEIYARHMQTFGNCDAIDFSYIRNRKSVILIKKAFPVSDKYVKNKYVDLKTGKDVEIKRDDQNRINHKLRKMIVLQGKGLHVFYNDVQEMRKTLIHELRNEQSQENTFMNGNDENELAEIEQEAIAESAIKVQAWKKLLN